MDYVLVAQITTFLKTSTKYNKLTLELCSLKSYQKERDEMKAHCIEHGIEYKEIERPYHKM
jgi:hypothetical protein